MTEVTWKRPRLVLICGLHRARRRVRRTGCHCLPAERLGPHPMLPRAAIQSQPASQ
jgi:hypothetical protein